MLICEAIASAAQARLVAANLCGGDVELHRDPPTVDTRLPVANVTYDVDRASRAGDPRHGTPEFEHTMTLIIDILDTGATGAALMAKLAAYGEGICQALLPDISWGGDLIEGISGVRQVTERATEGARIVYRRQVQIDVLHRSVWPASTAGLPDLAAIVTGVDLTGDGEPDLTATATLPTD
mgnify:CR=1 FL=1